MEFVRDAGGPVVLVADPSARALLADLFAQVAEMLEEGLPAEQDPFAQLVGISPDAAPPEDPAVARLLPAGTTDSPEAAAEFRRYTDAALRRRKAASLRAAEASLDAGASAPQQGTGPDRVELTGDQPHAWLTALNDVRLVLSERLGIHTDDDEERLAETLSALWNVKDPAAQDRQRLHLYQIYRVLAELLFELVYLLGRELPDEGRDDDQ